MFEAFWQITKQCAIFFFWICLYFNVDSDELADDKEVEKFLIMREKSRLKQWRKKNSEKVKEDRERKYAKDKETKENIIYKIFDAEKNDKENELYSKDAKAKKIHRRKRKFIFLQEGVV